MSEDNEINFSSPWAGGLIGKVLMWHGEINTTSFTVCTFGFIVNSSFLYLPKPLVIVVQPVHMFKYVFNRIHCFCQWYFCCISCHSSLHSCRNSNIYFLMIYVWLIHLLVKSSLCMSDLLRHHTLRGDLHGVICLIRSGVLLFQSVKQDGWLREHVFECLKSVSIWSGKVSQLPFKVEITPKVLVLLCSLEF